VRKGLREVNIEPISDSERIRKEGGGRSKSEIKDPTLRADLLKIVEVESLGDPQSPLRWVSKSVRHLTQALKLLPQPHYVSVSVVRRILHEECFSLQGNCKTKAGASHPDRDSQFQYIGKKAEEFKINHNPEISIDAKKKELIGNFKNGGKEWKPRGSPIQVQDHDFLPPSGIRAVPYGIYEMVKNRGFVNVGVSADTAVFAGKSILKWWECEGNVLYTDARELLITADGGGSNGYRVRLWKVIVQELSNKICLPITVCHYPPGTSKWNKIEHRLFAPITANWRATPLENLETMQNFISHTTTQTGLSVKCDLDLNKYERGIKISDKQMNNINIKRHEFHGEWNYTIYPKEKVIID
jgi:hypothetical protein